MVIIIDNYDSFTFNLFQFIGMLTDEVKVYRNDQITVEAIEALQPSHIILSPGPGFPENAGILERSNDSPLFPFVCVAWFCTVFWPDDAVCADPQAVRRRQNAVSRASSSLVRCFILHIPLL